MSNEPVTISSTTYQTMLETLNMEVEDRMKKLRQKAQLLKASLRLRLDLELGRYPPEVKRKQLKSFLKKPATKAMTTRKEVDKMPCETPLNANKIMDRSNSILQVPLSTRKGKESSYSQLVINLDSVDSPSTDQVVNHLDSPAREELRDHLQKLQAKITNIMKKVNKT